DMVVIVEDVIKLLDGVSSSLRRGKYPDPATSGKLAAVLRGVAADFDGA
ncbi:MAG TPA: cold-shock protein, partial [Dermatophilaceae bacterium]|nr:cold-shock protein [Dermatophilaceae bacterium]